MATSFIPASLFIHQTGERERERATNLSIRLNLSSQPEKAEGQKNEVVRELSIVVGIQLFI